MESAAMPAPAATPVDTSAPGAKGLKAGALGYMSNLVIAVASTAPAYSLADDARVRRRRVGIGTHAPAVLLVSFVPILFISAAYRYLNLADPDAGTSSPGQRARWAADRLDQRLGDLPRGRDRDGVTVGNRIRLHVPTRRLDLGVEVDDRDHHRLGCLDRADDMDLLPRHRALGADPGAAALAECLILAIFAVVALVKPTTATHGSIQPDSWFNPFGAQLRRADRRRPARDLHLLGLGLGRRGQRGVENPAEGPGRAAVLSTILLVLIYSRRDGRTGRRRRQVPRQPEQPERRAERARHTGLRLGTCRSCCSSRADLGLGVDADDDPADRPHDDLDGQLGSAPKVFGRVHPRFQTPSFSTLRWARLDHLDRGPARLHSPATSSATRSRASGSRSASTTASPASPARSTSGASSSRACAACSWSASCRCWASPRCSYIFVKDFITYSTPGYNYSPPLLGIQVPIVIGIGGLLLGLVFMIAQWIFMPEFFKRRPQTADPAILEEHLSGSRT